MIGKVSMLFELAEKQAQNLKARCDVGECFEWGILNHRIRPRDSGVCKASLQNGQRPLDF
jgi:hypothetical protein